MRAVSRQLFRMPENQLLELDSLPSSRFDAQARSHCGHLGRRCGDCKGFVVFLLPDSEALPIRFVSDSRDA